MNFNLDYGTSNILKPALALLVSTIMLTGLGAAANPTFATIDSEIDEEPGVQIDVEWTSEYQNSGDDALRFDSSQPTDDYATVYLPVEETFDSLNSMSFDAKRLNHDSDADYINPAFDEVWMVTEDGEGDLHYYYTHIGNSPEGDNWGSDSVEFNSDQEWNPAPGETPELSSEDDVKYVALGYGSPQADADYSTDVVVDDVAVTYATEGSSEEETLLDDNEGTQVVRSDIADLKPDSNIIQENIDAAQEGDAVKITPGTYEDSVTIDTARVTLEGAYPETEGSDEERGESEAVVDGRIKVVADGVTVTGLTVDGTDERAVAVGEAEGVTVSNNIIQDSKRGVQGDYYGRPTDLTVKNNLISTDYGIASTEGIDTLTVEENTFQTSEEGIGLGEDAVLADDEGVSGMFDDNTWNLEDGYAVKEYRQDGDVYVAEGGSIQSAIEVAGVKNSDNVYVTEESTLVKAGQGTYDEQVEISDKALTVEGNGESSTTITDTVTVDPGSDSDVTISSVKISTSGDGVNSIVQETGDLTVEESSLEVDADTPGAGYTPVIEVNNNDGVTEVIDSVISGSSQESEAEFGMWVGASSEGVTVNDVNFTDLRIGIESRTDIAVFDSNFNSFDTVGAQAIRVAEGDADEVGKVNISSNTFSVNPGLGDDTEEEFDGAPTAAIRFSDQTDSDNKINGPVTVVGNEFEDMSDGVAVSVGQEASVQSDIDARHNYWGQASGPTDSQIEGEVDFRPWLLEPEGERYDDTFSIEAEEWALVSPTKPVTGEPEVVGDSEGIEGTAMTYEDGEWSDVSDPSLEPLSSYYFRTSDSAGIGVNYEEASNPERVYNKQLQEGWNLIGSAVNTNQASTAFSTIQAVEQDGAMSVFVPTQANSQKRFTAVETWGEGGIFNAVPMSRLDTPKIEGEDIEEPRFDDDQYDELTDLTPVVTSRDGYWVYMSGDQQYSQTVQEGDNDLDRVEEYLPPFFHFPLEGSLIG